MLTYNMLLLVRHLEIAIGSRLLKILICRHSAHALGVVIRSRPCSLLSLLIFCSLSHNCECVIPTFIPFCVSGVSTLASFSVWDLELARLELGIQIELLSLGLWLLVLLLLNDDIKRLECCWRLLLRRLPISCLLLDAVVKFEATSLTRGFF